MDSESYLHPDRRGQLTAHTSLKELGEELQHTLQGYLPRASTPYKRVVCLLLAWEYQDDRVQQDFNEFRDLMRDHYHFEVDEYLVNPTKLQRTIDRELVDKCVQVQSRQDELLIFYYVGHAYFRESTRHTIFS
jgi:hypothetical protein